MEIWYDPVDGQVMAVYSGSTTSRVWGDQGFLMVKYDGRVTRDHKVTVVDDVVIAVTDSPNPADQETLDDARTRRTEELRQEARTEVTASIGDEFTRGKYVLRWAELMHKKAGAPLTAEEQTELDTLDILKQYTRDVEAEMDTRIMQVEASDAPDTVIARWPPAP